MMYTKSSNYTNIVVGKYEIQTFEVVIVVLLFFLLSFDVFVLTSTQPSLFGQLVYPNILKCMLGANIEN